MKTCPPCTNDCGQGRNCLLTGNSGNPGYDFTMHEPDSNWQFIGKLLLSVVAGLCVGVFGLLLLHVLVGPK